MNEYIKRDLLLKVVDKMQEKYSNHVVLRLETLRFFINRAPAEDVVKVVRCRDCRYFTKGMAVGMCYRVEDKPLIPVVYNHFCSYGERRDTL